MKREKSYCLLSAFFISILLIILTLKFTSIGINAILIYLLYFTVTSAVSVSILAVIKNKKSKANQYQLLLAIDVLIAILSLIFSLGGTIQVIKNIACVIFIFTFIMSAVLSGFCVKYERSEK